MRQLNRQFNVLWAGETVSQIGSAMTHTALPMVAVLHLHSLPFDLGLLQAARYAAYAFTFPAGLMADYGDRRRLLIGANLLRAIALLTIAILAVAHLLGFVELLLAAMMLGLGDVVFDTAYQAYYPGFVSAEERVTANSQLAISNSVAEISGPGLAGLLVQFLGAQWVFLLDAVSFLASALTVGITKVTSLEKRPRSRRFRFSEATLGIESVFKTPVLVAILASTATFNFFYAMLSAILIFFAVNTLHLGAGIVGIVMSAAGIGSFIGAMSARSSIVRVNNARALFYATLIGNGAYIILIFLPSTHNPLTSLAGLFAALFVNAAGCALENILSATIRQSLVERNVMGRAVGVIRTANYAALPIGALIGGIVGREFGIYTIVLVAALGMLASSLWLLPLLKLRTGILGPDASRL